MVYTDVLSVEANNSHDPNTRLSEYEMISQIRSALSLDLGHCYSSSSDQYAPSGGSRDDVECHEFSALGTREASGRASASQTRDRIYQGSQWWHSVNRGRSRAHAVPPGCGESTHRSQICTPGGLPATSQEHFRFHAPVHHIIRRSGEDDVLPLFEPIKTHSGTLITHVPLPEGINIVLSLAAYNRYADYLSTMRESPRLKFCSSNKKIWGDDADVFRPERWLEEKERVGPNVGGYSNL